MSHFARTAFSAVVGALLAAGCRDQGPADVGSVQVSTLVPGLEYPTGLWVRDGLVYVTETAGRNTSFGGKIRLLRYDVKTGQMQELLNNPENSDAVVAASDGTVYLTSYKNSIPSQDGDVSVVRLDAGQHVWQETHLLHLAIASLDMLLEANGDIFIIGSSDDSGAASLYRLSYPDYVAGASVVAVGLGRAQSLTKIGSDIYYSRFIPQEIRRLRDGVDTPVRTGVGVTSLTSDGTFLYCAEYFNDRITRMNLATGAVDTLAEGPSPTAVRYDARSGKLYFLEGGTEGAHYKDGALRVVTNLH